MQKLSNQNDNHRGQQAEPLTNHASPHQTLSMPREHFQNPGDRDHANGGLGQQHIVLKHGKSFAAHPPNDAVQQRRGTGEPWSG